MVRFVAAVGIAPIVWFAGAPLWFFYDLLFGGRIAPLIIKDHWAMLTFKD